MTNASFLRWSAPVSPLSMRIGDNPCVSVVHYLRHQRLTDVSRDRLRRSPRWLLRAASPESTQLLRSLPYNLQQSKPSNFLNYPPAAHSQIQSHFFKKKSTAWTRCVTPAIELLCIKKICICKPNLYIRLPATLIPQHFKLA